MLGASIAYWSGDARLLPGDIRAAQPTIFSSVPRIFERFEGNTKDQVGITVLCLSPALSYLLGDTAAPWRGASVKKDESSTQNQQAGQATTS